MNYFVKFGIVLSTAVLVSCQSSIGYGPGMFATNGMTGGMSSMGGMNSGSFPSMGGLNSGGLSSMGGMNSGGLSSMGGLTSGILSQNGLLGNGIGGNNGLTGNTGLVGNTFNIAMQALMSLLSIPGGLFGGQYNPTQQFQNTFSNQQLGSGNMQPLQQYISMASDPDVTQKQLSGLSNLLGQQNPQFRRLMTSAQQRELQQFRNFLTQMENIPQLRQIIQGILSIQQNQNLGLGQEVIKLLDLLLTLPQNIQMIICNVVQGATQNTPQLTINGLATLSATCQILDDGSPVAIGGLGGLVTNLGNGINGLTSGLGNTLGGLTGGLGNTLGGVTGILGGPLNGLGLGNPLSGLTNGLGNTLGGLTSGLGGAVNGLTNGLGVTLGGLGQNLGLQGLLGTLGTNVNGFGIL